jgi:hypothetical protein
MNPDQTRSSRPNFLRLVDTTSKVDPINRETFVRRAWQNTLFANENPSLLLFVNFEEVSENDFKAVLGGAQPKFLFDIRRVPRFDLGSLNRRQAFALFSKMRTRYVDLSARLNIAARPMSSLDPSLLTRLILDASNQPDIQGPIAFLVDTQEFDEGNISRLIGALPAREASPWDVLRVPITDSVQPQAQLDRTVIFISHANPEDNAFAAWLSGQLAIAGYSVWSDVTKLVGGEIFWDDIEETIRRRAAKVVAVLSVSAQQKSGFLDEVDLAVRVERTQGLKRFVIPVRLDELSYGDVRANIARKNVIDFKDNWALGLHSLLKGLERDGVPRSSRSFAGDLSRWVTERCAQSSPIVATPEKLTSNWLRILRLPEHIQLYDVSVAQEQIDSLRRSLQQPSFRYLRLIGSFATSQDLQTDAPPDVFFTEKYRIHLDHFLQGKTSELPGLTRREANKLAVNLLRQTWNFHMRSRGLCAFETASGQIAWYMPKSFIEGDRVEFQDDDLRKRRRTLVGWSDRRNVYWHFAVEARAILGDIPHFLLKPHVIFTPDGITPVESKERMHLLRRRFCKSWWNDRWRDLLIAFVTWLGGADGCTLSAGSTSTIQLEARLMSVLSPISINLEESMASGFESEDELDLDDDLESFEDLTEREPEDQRDSPGT